MRSGYNLKINYSKHIYFTTRVNCKIIDHHSIKFSCIASQILAEKKNLGKQAYTKPQVPYNINIISFRDNTIKQGVTLNEYQNIIKLHLYFIHIQLS